MRNVVTTVGREIGYFICSEQMQASRYSPGETNDDTYSIILKQGCVTKERNEKDEAGAFIRASGWCYDIRGM